MGSASALLNRGDIVAGKYQIEEWLGQGGMGAVFRVLHLRTKVQHALKVLHAHLVQEPEAKAMFEREASVGARIGKNPYIVKVLDAGIDYRTGVAYLLMDLLEGETLDAYIKERGPVPPELLIPLLKQFADALGQAHRAGVVHRDIKPSNLFLARDRKGNPSLVILDFGIAKIMDEGVQRTATPIGTPIYSAPEQLGSGARRMAEDMGCKIAWNITPAADTWALGVTTFELLTGAVPGDLWFDRELGSSIDLVEQIAAQPTPSARARAGDKAALLPPGFDAWLQKCLQKNARDRWPSIELAVQHLLKLFDPDEPALETVAPSLETTAPLTVEAPVSTCIIAPTKNENACEPCAPTEKLSQSIPIERSENPPQVGIVPGGANVSREVNPRKLGHRAKAMASAAVLASAAMVKGLVCTNADLNGVKEPERARLIPIDAKDFAHIGSSAVPESTTLPPAVKRPEFAGPHAYLTINAPPGCGAAIEKPLGPGPIRDFPITAGKRHQLLIACGDQSGVCWLAVKPQERQTVVIQDPELQFKIFRETHELVDCTQWMTDTPK